MARAPEIQFYLHAPTAPIRRWRRLGAPLYVLSPGPTSGTPTSTARSPTDTPTAPGGARKELPTCPARRHRRGLRPRDFKSELA